MSREDYLLSLIPNDLDYDEKYRDYFNKAARYVHNGVYHCGGYFATDTRELFLMCVLGFEGIKFDEEE